MLILWPLLENCRTLNEAEKEPEIDSRSIDAASRFDLWQRFPAVVLLAATLGLIVYGCFAGLDLIDRTAGVSAERTDEALYVAVAERVADGENYYRVAADEQRLRGYPLRPFVTVREPTLAYLTATAGGPAHLTYGLGVLAFLTAAALAWRLEAITRGRIDWWSSALLAAIGAGALVGHVQVVTHEVWAGMLIVLSIVFRGNKRYGASVGFGLGAVLIRELALPYLVVMAFFAWREGKRREMFAWVGATAVFAVAFVTHAVLVHSQVGAADPASPGWVRFGGWPFILDIVRGSSFLGVMPVWVAAAGVPLALLGWCSRCTPFANRVVVTIGTFMCAFMVIGRPENVYWGFLFVLLLIPGVALTPVAIWQLGKRVIS